MNFVLLDACCSRVDEEDDEMVVCDRDVQRLVIVTQVILSLQLLLNRI